ncbi:tetratricopeptide repeat protein [Streptomyces sp. NPDC093111]|uniref:tetratricopeptide repeat protein n=1 Tax=Streptomyces sp. NPDC093111 TaxID=3154978 RepID=UPI0034458F1D
MRGEERARLRDELRRPGGPRALVLYGEAGVGKTELARRIAEDLSRDGVHHQHWSAWADVTLVRLFGQLGASRRALVDLMAAEDASYPAVWDAVRARLFELPGRVVVFDDIPAPQAAEQLLGVFAETQVTVVFTSRATSGWETLPGCRAHQVRPLDAESCAVVAGRPPSEAGAVLAATGGMPALARMAAWRDGPLPPHPAALVRAALDDLPPGTRQALWTLRRWGLERFSRETLGQLDEHALSFLLSSGLAWNAGAGTYVLPSAVSDALGVSDTPRDQSLLMRVRLASVDITGAPQRQRLGDEYLDLACRNVDVLDDDKVGRLAAVRLLHHQVVALKWLAAHGVRTPANTQQFVAPACAAAAREVGRMERAGVELDTRFPGPEEGLLAHETGRLDEGLTLLSEAERASGADGFQLTTIRASVLTDQGYPAEAARMLREGPADAQEGGRVLVWRQIERARAHLLLGEPEWATGILRDAADGVVAQDRYRVGAWITLQEGRALLQQSKADEAMRRFRVALEQHRAVEDARGEAWTHHYMGLAMARRGMLGIAEAELAKALTRFRGLPDTFGWAWTLHRLGLMRRDAGDHDTAGLYFRDAAALFLTAGCPHGTAWSELELAALGARDGAGHLVSAIEAFSRLRDRLGMLWGAYFRAALAEPRGAAPRDVLAALEDCGQVTRSDVSRQIRTWRRPDPVLLLVPDRTRDTVLLSDTDPFGGACHVSLTLLDGPGTVVRLRVVPAAGHPWAGRRESLPWLSVVATPLTGCAVEPVTALVRPSPDPGLGAEFRFAPRRPGLHRIRFTIADEATGTVLQQVETEIDIVDADGEDLSAAPHPEHVWGA